MNMPRNVSSKSFNKMMEYLKQNKSHWISQQDARNDLGLHGTTIKDILEVLHVEGVLEKIENKKGNIKFYRLK